MALSGLETIAAVTSIVGTVASAAGTVAAGAVAKNNDIAKAQEMERKAQEERAVATREAIEKRREADLIQSKQLAGAAASGGSTTDATMLDIFSDTEAQGAYNSASAIYRGEASARNLEAGAANARASAKTRMPAAYLSAGGSLMSDFGKNGKSYAKLFD